MEDFKDSKQCLKFMAESEGIPINPDTGEVDPEYIEWLQEMEKIALESMEKEDVI